MDEVEEEMKQIERIMLLEREQRKLEDRAKALERERDELKDQIKQMVAIAADNHLEGYRELAMKVAKSKDERDDARRDNATLRAEVEMLKQKLASIKVTPYMIEHGARVTKYLYRTDHKQFADFLTEQLRNSVREIPGPPDTPMPKGKREC